MAPQYTLISKLTPKTSKAALHVRATRIWESTQKQITQKQITQKQQKKLFHTAVVFVDEEASLRVVTLI